jgi:hypothetical protein
MLILSNAATPIEPTKQSPGNGMWLLLVCHHPSVNHMLVNAQQPSPRYLQ